MAPDDRDRTFEKALARHLRSSASSGPDANALAGAPADPSAESCPDPEILAAYHDGSLSPEERNLWKRHVVGCDRCQFVLACLETPLDTPVHVETKETVLAGREPAPAEAGAVARKPVAVPIRQGSARWLWLVPTGAIAAGLLVWVSFEERRPVEVRTSSPVEIAKNRQSPSVAPSAEPAPPVAGERKETDQRAAPSVGGVAGAASANRDLDSERLRNQVQLTQQSPFRAAAKAAHGPSLPAQKQEQQMARIASGDARAFDQKKLDAQSLLDETRRSAGSLAKQVPASPLPPAPLPSSEPSFLADGSVPAPRKDKAAPAAAPPTASNLPSLKQSSRDLETLAASGGSLEDSAAPESKVRAQERAVTRAAVFLNPHVFWAPGGREAWRIGPAGSLEHSKDKGLNWIPQISGVYTDLLAGSAPSAKVCWIVGTSGTILRTTDGGTHWIKLDSPVTRDLAGIRAADAMHASIWFVTDPETGLVKTYQTTDGGATWSLVPNP
jgi:hypothetical protein